MLGKRLKGLRGSRTQQFIADRLDISRARYSHYENDRVEPDTDILKRMADLFKVSVDYLIGRTDDVHYGEKNDDLTVQSIMGGIWREDPLFKNDEELYEIAEKLEIIINSGKRESINEALNYLDFLANKNK